MAQDSAFEGAHSDHLTVIQQNDNGTKLLTASIDHRVAVYDIDRPTGKRKQLDVFGVHDAEVRDAKWFHSSIGTYFITIANDLQARIWTQDLSQAPMSGRRFRKVATIKCEQFMPFVSVDVKTVGTHTYVVLIDRQGLLSLYEPSSIDDYTDWSLVDQLHVVSPVPARGEHTSFRVAIDQNPFPLPYVQNFSDDQGQITIGVTALSEFKVYRSTTDSDATALQTSPQQPTSNIGRGASHRFCLFEVLRVQPTYSQPQTSAGLLLRDIAFRPGNVRGADVIAVSSINGAVSIFEVVLKHRDVTRSNVSAGKQVRLPTQSNLTSALHPSTTASQTAEQATTRTTFQFDYDHHVTPISILEDAHIDAWSVQWDLARDVLLSTGADGTVKIWRRVISGDKLSGFALIGEQTIEDDSEEDDESLDDVSGRP